MSSFSSGPFFLWNRLRGELRARGLLRSHGLPSLASERTALLRRVPHRWTAEGCGHPRALGLFLSIAPP